MNCTQVRKNASLYVDHQLPAPLLQQMTDHALTCAECSKYIEQIRHNIRLLANIEAVAPPAKLKSDIIAKASSKKRELSSLIYNFALYTKPKLTGYSVGAVVTCLLFFTVLYQLKPTFRLSKDFEDKLIAAITVPEEPLRDTLPRVELANPIVELTFGNNNREDIFVITEVSMQGEAKLIELVDSPNNAQFENVAAALKRASFKPATKAGKPINSRILLLIQTIDVRG